MHVTLCPIVVGGSAPTLVDAPARPARAQAVLVATKLRATIFLHYRNLREGLS